jgi:hypothetical protein
VPVAVRLTIPAVVSAFALEPAASDMVAIVASAFLGPFAMGVFFAAIALLGLEHQQAFCVLGHPGFKHFVRLCVRASGAIDAWVIGKDDPLGEGEPMIVDRFDWDAGRRP